MPSRSRPLPQPSLAAAAILLRRYDGPAPSDELLAALVGEPIEFLRQRAVNREIDRMALNLGRSIASRRERLTTPSLPCSQEDRLALDQLSRRLGNYRDLGLRLAES